MKRDKLVTLQWSQSSDIMGGYNTRSDSMVRDRTSVSTMK